MSGLPSVVEKEAQEADEALKRLIEEANPEPEKGSSEVSQNTSEAEAQATADSQAIGKTSEEQGKQEEAPSGQTPAPGEVGDYKAMYESLLAQVGSQPFKVLQGKYNSEVPRLSAEIGELRKENDKLKARIEEVGRSRTPEPKPEADGAPSKWERVKSGYDEDLVQGTEELVAGSVSKVERGVTDLKDQFTRIQEQNAKLARTLYFSELSREISNWREVNKDPKFRNFLLNQVDPTTGKTKLDLLVEADKSNDSSTAISYIKEFVGASGRPDLQKQKEKLLHPSTKSESGDTTIGEKKRTYTQAQVTALYKDRRDGKYLGREAEWAAIERDLTAASFDGRLI